MRRSWSLPVVAVLMVATAELVNPAILPAFVQRVRNRASTRQPALSAVGP